MPEKIIAASLQVDTGNSVKNVSDVGDALKTVKGGLESTGASAKNTGKNISDTGGHFTNLKSQLNTLPGSFKGVSEGATGFNAALNLLRANPIIAVITLLAGLIFGLFQKFKQMEGVSDALGKAFGSLSALFNGFISKILTPLIEGFSKLIGFIADAAEFIVGIFSPGLAEAAKRSGELAEALDNLNDAEAESAIRRAESNRKLQEAKDLANDANVPIKDRIAALKEAAKIEKEEFDKSIEIATQRAKLMLEQIAIELGARKELVDAIRNGSIEQLKAARAEIFAMKNVDKEKLKAIDELIIRAEDEGAQRAKVNKKTEQNISALEKEEENKRKEERQKAADARKKAIERQKAEEDKLYQFNSKLRQLQQENDLSQIKDGYQRELLALQNKLAADKEANLKAVKDKRLTIQQALALNDELQEAANIKSNAITEKHNKEVADKEKAFQDKLAKLKQEIMLGGIVDQRQLEREQLNISREQELEQAKKDYADNAQQLAEYNALIEEKYRQKKAQQDAKFKEEDDKKKLEQDKKTLEDNLAQKKELAGDPAADFDARRQAIADELALLEEAKNNKILNEQEYLKAKKEISEASVALDEAEANARQRTISAVGNALGQLSKLAGEKTVAGKALAIAQTTIDTYQSATSAYKSLAGIPVVGPALGAIAAAAAVAAGIANVKKIVAVKVPGGGGGSAPSVTAQAPLTPQVQGTRLDANSINSVGNAANQNPVQAYVVESQGADSQERIARLSRAARIG